MRITSQAELRRAFWAEYQDIPEITQRRIPDHSGIPYRLMYNATTRSAFVEFIDAMERSGVITSDLAQRVTL